MHRFFIAPELIQGGMVSFPEGASHQISRVLRLKAGQIVVALDNLGMEYEVQLEEARGRHAAGRVIQTRPAPPGPRLKLSLYLCLSQREKFEWMLQKCTEIGAADFTPVVSSRSLVQEREDKGGRRMERWVGILREAAEQSGRGQVPSLHPAKLFHAAIDEAVKLNDRTLLPTLNLSDRSGLKTALGDLAGKSACRIAVIIGPEGGFSPDEEILAREAGCQPVSLGPRVLRMETAAVAAAALILYEYGEMG